MRIVRNLLLLTLFFSCATSSVYSEPPCCYNECEPCGEAYSQGSCTAHWSAYVPIVLIVGAAIWFGVADGNSSSSSNSNSKDGLGSLASSKRRSSSHSYSSYSSSYHCHCN